MQKRFSEIKFDRYADDVLVHCSTQEEAEKVLEGIRDRLKECYLDLNEEKIKIVYCKNSNRKGSYEHENLEFLGYTFRPRLSKNKMDQLFVGFTPAISREAASRIRREIRGWRIHLRSDKKLEELARMFNRYVQGWVNYYGRY
jgi:RNA-directed DNA polymerase